MPEEAVAEEAVAEEAVAEEAVVAAEELRTRPLPSRTGSTVRRPASRRGVPRRP